MARSIEPVIASSRLRALAAHPETRRAFLFLLVGGVCAVFNLAIFSALSLLAGWSYLPAVLIATELSVMLGFVLNDRITFRSLAQRAGGWLQRCIRFHLGAAMGQALTILLGLGLIHVLARIPMKDPALKPVLAQAISLAVVTVFNFAVQRFLTYRARTGSHQATLPHAEPEGGMTSTALPASVEPVSRVAAPVSMYTWARLHPPQD